MSREGPMARTVIPKPRERSGEVVGDALPVKLVKYVPAEVLAFFIPLAAVVGDDRKGLLWLVTAVAVIGAPLYLAATAKRLPPEQRPARYFYLLAVLATVAWLFGTSAPAADLIGLDEVAAAVVLALAVFIIPVVDGLLDQR